MNSLALPHNPLIKYMKHSNAGKSLERKRRVLPEHSWWSGMNLITFHNIEVVVVVVVGQNEASADARRDSRC